MPPRAADLQEDAIAALDRRCRHYAAIAELSLLAIGAPDANDLLPRAIELCRSILGIEIDPKDLSQAATLHQDVTTGPLDAESTEFLAAVSGVLQRVRQQRERERLALAEVEGRFSRIFQHSPVALAMSTIGEGRFLDVNERWLSMFGFTREETIGRTNAELRLFVDPGRRTEIVNRARAHGTVRDAEMALRTKSGDLLDIIVSSVPIATGGDDQVWITAIVDITDRKRAEAERNELQAREQIAKRALSRQLLTAQEEERRRVAVELHDELGQILTAVKINLESFERAPYSPPTRANLVSMIDSVDDALQRVKDIALDLRPSVLDDLGLEAALRWFADRCTLRAGLAAHLSIDALPRLEPNLQTACFRVTQEALTNVERHARARHVWIDLHILDGSLELSVRDDGVGFDVAAARARAHSGSSVGLLGMQERVSLMGGEYDIVQPPAGGTEVRARFPLSGTAA